MSFVSDPEKDLAREIVDDFVRDMHERTNAAMCEMAGALCAMDNSRVHCNVCRREEKLTIESTMRYLEFGWPQCCEAQMSLRTGYGEN